MKRFKIFVEGEADKKFFEDYFSHLFGFNAPESINKTDDKNETGGKDKLKKVAKQMEENTDQGGVNLVIFDADKDTIHRRSELLKVKTEIGVDFKLFLLPNDNDNGTLEDLLEKIINPDNQPVMDCWQTYEDELKKVRIPTKTPPTLTIPAKKTKIYAYLETLHGETKAEKKLVKDRYRNFRNPAHWNLDAEYLTPLRDFLTTHINNPEF